MFTTLQFSYHQLHTVQNEHVCYVRTSCAVNGSIFRVATVVISIVGTVNQSALSSCTSHIIQENGDIIPLAKTSTRKGNWICATR